MTDPAGGTSRPSAEQLAGFLPPGALPAAKIEELARAACVERMPRGSDPLLAHAQGGEALYLLSGEALLVFEGGGTLVVVGATGDGRYQLNRRTTPITRAKAISDIEVLWLDERRLDAALTLEALASLEREVVPGEEVHGVGAERDPAAATATYGTLLRLAQSDFDALLREPRLRRLSRAEGGARAARGAIWLDVRQPSEWRNDRIAGALNLPLGGLNDGFARLDRGKPYIVYCQSGRRSAAAALLLARRGLDVWLLDGGLPGGKQS